MDNTDLSDDQQIGLATSRSRRQKPDKQGRYSALEKLKTLKGSKHKYKVKDVINVYEEVSEKEYSKRRQERLEEDWIVDDDGSGYADDGREIFEDEDDTDDIFVSKKKKDSGNMSGSSKRASVSRNSGVNIKNLLFNMPAKKKKTEKDINLDGDDILGDILQDIDKTPVISAVPTVLKKKTPNTLSSSSNFKSEISKIPIKTFSHVASENKITVPDSPKKPLGEQEYKISSQTIEEFDSADIDDIEMIFSDNENVNMQPVINENNEVKQTEVKTCISSESFDEKQITNKCCEKPNSKTEAVLNECVISSWETFQKVNEKCKPIVDLCVDSSHIPLITNVHGDKVLRFFWLDAFEDYFKQPGILYLFGKVKIDSINEYVSCCITVRNLERVIHLLPRSKKYDLKSRQEVDDDVTFVDVYKEFNKLAEKYKIDQFKSRKMTKSYVFEIPDVPKEAEYFEVRYPACYNPLPNDISGETFSHAFGTNTSCLEHFILECKLKGPCWLEVKAPNKSSVGVSWCKIEVECLDPQDITVINDSNMEIPPLVVMSLRMQTTVNPKTHQNEITLISCLMHQKFPLDSIPPDPPFQAHFCAVTHPSDVPWPWDLKKFISNCKATKVEKMESERALLGFFLAKYQKLDPDVVVGHDVLGFDLNVILHRISTNKIPQWSRLSRLKRTYMPKLSEKFKVERIALCGRLLCDVKLSAKELIRVKSYNLPTLTKHILKPSVNVREELTYDEVKQMFDSSAAVMNLIGHTLQEALYIIKLMCDMNVLPLALQITSIAGNLLSRTLLSGRSERNEYLLLHAFTERHYIVPDKIFKKSQAKRIVADVDEEESAEINIGQSGASRKKPSYAGGLVLEPKKGLYDKYVILMDFNSLYPSIIQEYNICFSTISFAEKQNDEIDFAELQIPENNSDMGILPREIRKLVESRRQVKNLMKQQDLPLETKLKYEIRQKALKLMANSMYGCLGFSSSRFYARYLAALVTGKGREILLNTKGIVEKMNFEVIYGDTDSIFINTNCTDYEEVFKLGQKIKSEVNKLYKNLELEIDGVFKRLLLLKKKKYAAVTITRLLNGNVISDKELKGLDIVRRDWCQLTTNVGNCIIDYILSELDSDEVLENIHSHLENIKTEVLNDKLDHDVYVITKQLTKNPEDYPDKKALPHVQVALRVNSRGGKKLRQGDTVSYIICEDGSDLAATQRAYHIEEIKASDKLQIDKKYYLAHQLHPTVSRLCDPIEGTDAARIAECLGLDSSSYRNSIKYNQVEDETELASIQLSDEEKYKHCEHFSFSCPEPNCEQVIKIDGAFRPSETSGVEAVLQFCPNAKCHFPLYSKPFLILNKLKMDIRKHILQYYCGWLICDDPGCSHRCRHIPLRFSQGFPICNACERGVLMREYSDSKLFKQLCFYEHIFDFAKACQKNKDERIRDESLRKCYNMLHNEVQKSLKLNAYSEINLGRLFGRLMIKH